MKKILTTAFIVLLTGTHVVSAQQFFYPGFSGLGGGINGGAGVPNGGYNFQSPGQQESVPVFANGITSGAVQYKNVKINAKCPLLTSTTKDDTDIFSDLKNFISTAAKNPNCSLRPNENIMAAMTGQSGPNVSMLESMLSGSDSSSGSSMMDMSAKNVKCYSKNVELIGQRNLAYYYSEKEMESTSMTPFSSCLDLTSTPEKRKVCIEEKYNQQVEENQLICKEMIAPQAIQKQVNKGLIGLEQLLNQALSNKEECGFKSQDLFKVTMNTFLKAKALSVVGPWGAVAGFGAELVGNLLDKLFPSDSQKATELMDEILNEETFEQNACLYFNIQQKMYCEERPVEIATPNPGCQTINVNSDLLKLIQKYMDVKKVTDTFNDKPNMIGISQAPGIPMSSTQGGQPPSLSPEMETAMIEHLDDLAKFAVSSEADLKERIKSLPKIQQGREQKKLESFLKLMKDYQGYEADKDAGGVAGKKLMNDIAIVMADKTDNKLDLSSFIVKTTPGTKLEMIKQRSIARTIEQLMAAKDDSYIDNESSRTMARYNKYKVGMGTLAKNKFEIRLEKQFREFENQVKFVSSKDKGVVSDPVAEGQLRNLVRHCSLLQEVYDPNLEGKIPKVCQKLSCSDNKLNWFKPDSSKSNFTGFKKHYCDKSLSFQKVEGDYIKELQDKSGAKICGVKVESFF